MNPQEKLLLDLRLRYDSCEAFDPKRSVLWAKIQDAETKVDPDVARAIVAQVIFAEAKEEEQLSLAI